MPITSFNPRTREGCDAVSVSARRRALLFQSTHPWRVRLVLGLHMLGLGYVSIHAPVKGATLRLCSLLSPPSFQSTHPWRVRHYTIETWYGVATFQSTHPWRVRRPTEERPSIIGTFQSTHPWRVRLGLLGRSIRRHKVSIHAPVKGATAKGLFTVSFACIDGDMAPLIHFLLTTLGIWSKFLYFNQVFWQRRRCSLSLRTSDPYFYPGAFLWLHHKFYRVFH